MRSFNRVSRGGLLVLGAGAIAIGATTLLQSRAVAGGPTPDCGPTRQWVCVVPGCPDCYEVLFEGTVCEMQAYEKASGRKCSPQ